MTQLLRNRAAGVLLSTVIVALTLATAYIHLGLGGLLFTLNGLGYLGLAGLFVIGAAAPIAIVRRFDWFPRLALIGYTGITIVGYLVMGPYFTLGFDRQGHRGSPGRGARHRHRARLRKPRRVHPQCARFDRAPRPQPLPPGLVLTTSPYRGGGPITRPRLVENIA